MVIKLKFKKLDCDSCWKSIENELLKHDGITPSYYDLLDQTGEVEFDESKYKPEDIVEILKKIGWKSEIIEVE